MFCGNCGKKLNDGVAFCDGCGSPVVNESVPAGAPEAQRPAPERAPMNPPAVAQMNTPGGKPAKKKGAKGIIIAAIALVLAAAIIITIIAVSGSGSPLSADDAAKEYLGLLEKYHDDVSLFQTSTGANGVSFLDLNGSGIPDMVYVTQDKDSDLEHGGLLQLHIAYDRGKKIADETFDVGKNFVFFTNRITGDLLFLYRESVPKFKENIYIEKLAKLNVSKDDKDITMTDAGSRYYDSGKDEPSYTPPEDGAEDFSGSTGIFEEPPESGSIIIIDPIGPEVYPPLIGDDPENISIDIDEAEEQLRSGSFGASAGAAEGSASDDRTEAAETAAPAEPAVITDVDSAQLPESLGKFLYFFDWTYHSDDGKTHKEYDCENLTNCYSEMVKRIASAYSCVCIFNYPHIEYESSLTGKSDPLGKFDGIGYVKYKEDDIIWFMKNVFHIKDEDVRPMIDAALASGDSMYEYDDGGTKYLCSKFGAKGDPYYTTVYDTVKFDGEKYYIIYDYQCIDPKSGDSVRYYTEVSEAEENGFKYWTMYKHTEDIPDMPESGSVASDDSSGSDNSTNAIYADFAGSYLFSSGAGGWSTSMDLKADGTVKGVFTAQERSMISKDYNFIQYYSEFSGKCSGVEKVDDCTYTFTISDIKYSKDPGTEEILTLNGEKTKRVYSIARGVEDGVNTVYAYTADTSVSKLSKSFVTDINNMRWSEKDSPTLLYKCLYFKEYGSAWLGTKG